MIERKLDGRGVECLRPEKEISDQRVMEFAVSHGVPLLTRDQGDYIRLGSEMEHPGVLIDKQMHLRDKSLVAETVADMLERYDGEIRGNVLFVSNFYGRF